MSNNKNIQFSVYINPTLFQQVEQLAHQYQRSVSWTLAWLVAHGHQALKQKTWVR